MRVFPAIAVSAICMLAVAACSTGPQISMGIRPVTRLPLPPAGNAVLRIDANRSLLRVPKRFLGLSIEGHDICYVLGDNLAQRARFEAALKAIGPGVIKIGGRSTDLAKWQPNGEAQCSPKHTVFTLAEAKEIFGVAKRTGFKVIWDLPLIHFDPSADAKEAAQLFRAGGNLISGWMIGNEPDLYVSSGLRTLPWGYAQFFHQWRAVEMAVKRAVPMVGFIGPETCCNPLDFGSFAIDAQHDVIGLSLHLYGGSRPKHPINLLLSPKQDKDLAAVEAYAWEDGAATDKLPLYLTETNSFPFGGVTGVSDRYVAAIWLVDWILRSISLHFSQIDVQQSAAADAYDPFNGTDIPQATYEAMRFVHQALPPGCQLLASSLRSRANMTAYAFRDGKAVRLIVVNKSARPQTVAVKLSQPFTSSQITRMSAPTLRSWASAIRSHTFPSQTEHSRGMTVRVSGHAVEIVRLALSR